MNTENSLSVFWIKVENIDPNPYQPRREFRDNKIDALSRSIRQYGVLQPIVVTKKKQSGDYGDIDVRYELISGERRLRAAKLAGLTSLPAVIRNDEIKDSVKLELAIIENLEREDLNPVDRALAFKRLTTEFNLSNTEIAQKMNRSREYVSNTLRLLQLPEEMINAVVENKISEGHTRPLLMLNDKKEEQEVLFLDIINRNLTVREAEFLARKQAIEKSRKKPRRAEIEEAENHLKNILEKEVSIMQKGKEGGRIVIDFEEIEELNKIMDKLKNNKEDTEENVEIDNKNKEEDGDDIYSFKNFSL